MKVSPKILKTFFVAITFFVFATSQIFACPSCGSANGDMPSSPLTDGMNLGILTLFGVITIVLGSIATFFIVIIRRGAAAAAKAADENVSEVKV